MNIKISKRYSIRESSCDCHPETCCHWSYALLKDDCMIDGADDIKDLNFPNDNIRFKTLDFYGFQNHKKTKAYKKWRNK